MANFVVLFELPFTKNSIASKKHQTPAGYEATLLKRKDVWS
jgi:hypothetical protein